MELKNLVFLVYGVISLVFGIFVVSKSYEGQKEAIRGDGVADVMFGTIFTLFGPMFAYVILGCISNKSWIHRTSSRTQDNLLGAALLVQLSIIGIIWLL